MTMPDQVKWGSYQEYEGPYFGGTSPYQLSDNPSENEKVLRVVTATEGGHYDAINMYDRCIISVGLIQWCEAGQYSVSDMLGQVVRRDPALLEPLKPAMSASKAIFQMNPRGKYRFFQNGSEVDTLAEQQKLFLKNSTGLRGSWDQESRGHSRLWAACMANVFQQPGAQTAQCDYTVPRLMDFVTSSAKSVLWAPQDPPGIQNGWYGALRSAYISFAANNPTIASNQLQKAIASTKSTRWSAEWCQDILKQLTFGPQIAIYPDRYNRIRPVLESLFGVDLPDTSQQLQTGKTGGPSTPTFSTTQEIQNELLAEGYDLGPSGADGRMGQKTRLAIMTFQRLRGLEADGLVGPKTQQALADEWKKRNPS